MKRRRFLWITPLALVSLPQRTSAGSVPDVVTAVVRLLEKGLREATPDLIDELLAADFEYISGGDIDGAATGSRQEFLAATELLLDPVNTRNLRIRFDPSFGVEEGPDPDSWFVNELESWIEFDGRPDGGDSFRGFHLHHRSSLGIRSIAGHRHPGEIFLWEHREA
ncbi:MAG: hypothetical protein GF330_11025 [Candidatus Eisenbacteria bacterium]|nr:hypothetical protein [Candidatus Eisenbacteria bacterium]